LGPLSVNNSFGADLGRGGSTGLLTQESEVTVLREELPLKSMGLLLLLPECEAARLAVPVI